MRLKSLEIEGFKSFAKKTSFNFNTSLIAIVGPNGSGKSNIVDAIRWLLGEQSSKQIRITEKDDVIFAGTESSGPSSFASVTLNITDDYGNDISLSKTVEKNNSNKYMINGKSASLKDFYSVFNNRGVGKQFYSIISQGQVSEIVKSSPENLRDIVLDSADIGDYLSKKKNSLEMLSKSEENLERLKDVLYMMDKNIKSLSNRASRAKKHLELKNELTELSKKYFGAKKIKLIDTIESIRKETEELENIKKFYLSQSFDLEREYRSLKNDIEDAEKELGEKNQLIENYNNRLKSIEEERSKINSEINEINSKIISTDWEINSSEENLKKLSNRLGEVKDLESKYKKDSEDTQKIFDDLTEKKNLIEEKISEQLKILTDTEQEIKDREKNLKYNTSEKLDSVSKINSLSERLDFLKSEHENLKNDIISVNKKIEEIEEKLTEKNNEELSLRKKITDLTEKFGEIKAEYDIVIKELENLNSEKLSSERKINMFETEISGYAGYSETIKYFFSNYKEDKNVIDVVANLINTDEQFEEAISSAVGYKLQNIVVKNSSKVSEYIHNIKKNVYGKITFLPLDLMKTKISIKNQILSEPGCIDYLINIAQFDDQYRTVMEYVFSNILLVDVIENGIALIRKGYNGTLVTLTGEILSGSGTITGGKNKKDYNSEILKRKRDLETEKEILNEINENIKFYMKEYTAKKNKLEKLKTSIEEEKENLSALLMEKNIHNSSYKNLINEKAKKETSLKDLGERLENYSKEIKNLNLKLSQLQQSIDTDSELLVILREKYEKFTFENSSEKENLNLLNSSLSEKKVELNYTKEKYNNFHREKMDLLESNEKEQFRLSKLKTSFSSLKETIDEKRKILSDFETEYKNTTYEIDNVFKMLKNSRSGKMEKAEKLEELEKKRTKTRGEISDINSKIQGNSFKTENLNHEINFLTERAKTFDVLQEEFILEKTEDSEIERYEIRIEDIEKNLKNLGSVDLTVIEEYDKVKSEFDEKNTEKDDILLSINSLKETIRELDDTAEEKFTEFFTLLNNSFKEYITALFANGYGELRLEGEGKNFEKGIVLSVKKSGRNFQKLSLFSGGEKALIATAFLFALMDLNPSPFYILDEIDAPLDDINAGKIARLIKSNADKSQFL
ncbi:MAG TPA: chromosome segregation protein SMC, partial [Tepiditoga sp.]|nr:chromosome segregation protein SMC [Tepiditoga sp.]